jgi:hypothetical protein
LVELKWRVPLTRFRVCSLLFLVGNCWMVNLRSGGAIRWKTEDRRLGRVGRVLWKADTSNVIDPAYVS